MNQLLTLAESRDQAELLRDAWERAMVELGTTRPGTAEWTAARLAERETFAEYLRGQFEKR